MSSAPPPPPPGYGPPGYGPPGPGYDGPPRSSPKALAAMITGIVSLVLGLCGCLGLVGIVGVVLGLLAKKDIAAANGRLTGSGRATIGIVTGAIGAVVAVVWLGFVAWQVSQGEDVNYQFGTS